jgi:thiosulfate/3-mercaptopyruvate sulfurtransferase
VLASLNDANTQIWDARSPEEYMGTKVVAARGGHIPGAINIDWLEMMDRQRGLRLREDLAELITAKGFESSSKIMTHCQTHHRSGLTYLVGKMLDLNIKAYHGSWSEWGNDSDTPIDNPSA